MKAPTAPPPNPPPIPNPDRVFVVAEAAVLFVAVLETVDFFVTTSCPSESPDKTSVFMPSEIPVVISTVLTGYCIVIPEDDLEELPNCLVEDALVDEEKAKVDEAKFLLDDVPRFPVDVAPLKLLN